MKYLFMVLFCSIGAQFSNAQSLSIVNVDATNFPTISAKFYAFDAAGIEYPLNKSDINLTENGQTRAVTNVTCPLPKLQKALSSVLVIDVSSSMSAKFNQISCMDLAKSGARTWINKLQVDSSECAITSFDDRSYLNIDFNSDRSQLLNAIDPLKPQGGTDYDAAFINQKAGGLAISKTGKNKKIIIFLTDGQPSKSPQVDSIVNEANRQNCTIYCVTIGIYAPQALRDIATKTGGLVFENITAVKEIEDVYLKIFSIVQSGGPCTVEWQSSVSCWESHTNVEMQSVPLGSRALGSYKPPVNSVGYLEFSPPSLIFKNAPLFQTTPATITVTARNMDFNVVNIIGSNSAFKIVESNFQLIKDVPQNLTVNFTPQDSGYIYGEFLFQSSPCIATLHASGGFVGKKPKNQSLKVTSPNGGERYSVGNDTLISWEGVSKSDTVLIEYSSNNGKSWRFITDSAHGLQYLWKNIPRPESNQCKIRVKQIVNDSVRNNNSGSLQFDLQGHTADLYMISWSPDGKKVATACKDKTAIVWDAENGTKLFTLLGHKNEVSSVNWSPNGTKIVTASSDQTVMIWDAENGDSLFTINGYNGMVDLAVWSPDGNKVAIVSYSKTAVVWDSRPGAALYTLNGHSQNIRTISWSPDGTKIASAGLDQTAIIWNSENGEKLFTLKEHNLGLSSVQWSPDGSKVVTTSYDKTAVIWDATEGVALSILRGHTNSVVGANWSPDGSKIVTSSSDKTGIIWDVQRGIPIDSLIGHKGEIHSIGWNPTGSKIATASEDKTVIIWDAANGKKLYTFDEHTKPIRSLAWSPDGSRVATASSDHTAKIWFVGDVRIALQEEESDNVFSIVQPKADASGLNLLQCLVGSIKDSVVPGYIRNVSSNRCKIDSIYFTGSDANDFSLVSGIPKYDLNEGESKSTEFRFAPRRIGMHYATVNIISQSEIIKQTIEAEGIPPTLQIIADLIDFGQVPINNQKDILNAVIVKNINPMPITINDVRSGGQNNTGFSIVGNTRSFTINPNDTARLSLRFAPKDIGRASGQLFLDYDGIGSPAMVQLFGEGFCGIDSTRILNVGLGSEVSVVLGSIVKLPLVMKLPPGQIREAIARRFFCTLSFDASMLLPLDSLPRGVLEGNRRIIKIDDNRLKNSDTMKILPFLTMLGADSVVKVYINSLYFDDIGCPITVNLDSVTIKFTDFCTAGGSTRLLVNSPITKVVMLPNPTEDNSNILLTLAEDSPVTISVHDIFGRQVMIKRQEMLERGSHLQTFDCSLMPSGIYSLMLTTRNEVKFLQFVKR